MNDLMNRIQDYLSTGGLYSPELADHTQVRDLLIDVLDYFMSVQIPPK